MFLTFHIGGRNVSKYFRLQKMMGETVGDCQMFLPRDVAGKMHGSCQAFLPKDVDRINVWQVLGLFVQGCLSKKCLAITKPFYPMMLVKKCLVSIRQFNLGVVMGKTLSGRQTFHSMDGQWRNA